MELFEVIYLTLKLGWFNNLANIGNYELDMQNGYKCNCVCMTKQKENAGIKNHQGKFLLLARCDKIHTLIHCSFGRKPVKDFWSYRNSFEYM